MNAIDSFDAALPHGITLNCLAAGPKDAEVIMFLHGFPEAAFVWEGLMRRFATRYRCIAPNLRGYADSSAPQEVEAYRAKHLVRDIVALLAQQAPVGTDGRPRLAALVAHDWGGAIAWNLAIAQPALLPRLVIVNAPHPGSFLRDLKTDPAQQAASAYMNFLCRPDAALRLAENDYALLWRLFLGMGPCPWLDDALRSRYRTVWQRGLDPALNYYRASPFRPPTAGGPDMSGLELGIEQLRTTVPTWLVWGEEDQALRVKLTEGLEPWVQSLRIHRVPGASHWVVHERPDDVANVIEDALQS